MPVLLFWRIWLGNWRCWTKFQWRSHVWQDHCFDEGREWRTFASENVDSQADFTCVLQTSKWVLALFLCIAWLGDISLQFLSGNEETVDHRTSVGWFDGSCVAQANGRERADISSTVDQVTGEAEGKFEVVEELWQISPIPKEPCFSRMWF